jgi:hypothetical protein
MGGDEKKGDLRDSKQGKPWENHGKTHGKAWGKWDFHRKPWKKDEKVVIFDQNSKKVDHAWPQTVRN